MAANPKNKPGSRKKGAVSDAIPTQLTIQQQMEEGIRELRKAAGIPEDNAPIVVPPIAQEILQQRFEEARQEGAVGYMVRSMTQATLPHAKIAGNEFIRTNGMLTLSIMTPSKIGGLPYGTIPRLLVAYISTEAVKKQDRTIFLGRSLTEFMQKLGFQVSGGEYGSLTRFKMQATRLFSSNISVIRNDQGGHLHMTQNLSIADKSIIWWNPLNPSQQSLFESSVHLSEQFFNEIIENPVQIDTNILKQLKNSCMSMDVYFWLEARKQYLVAPTCEPWEALFTQFGCEYRRLADFQRKFAQHLQKIIPYHGDLSLSVDKKGLHLKKMKYLR